MRRMSSLPLSQFCGKAHQLDNASGRAAALSTAWHARLAGTPGNAELLARLTDKEAETVLGWPAPADVPLDLGGGWLRTLRYEEADKELEVGLTAQGGHSTGASCVSLGHLDMAWVVEHPDGRKIAYVGDLKKGEHTSHPGSLQLLAYGFAYAALKDCDAFCCGIWAGEEGTWTWGEFVDLESELAQKLLRRVVAAATNDSPEYSMGVHCRDCFGRFRCPAYVIPPGAATGALSILDGKTEITADKVADLVLAVARVEDMTKTAKEFCKDWAAKNGPVVKDGKEWRAIQMPGRKGLDMKALFAAMPEARRFEKQGEGYTVMKWVNR